MKNPLLLFLMALAVVACSPKPAAHVDSGIDYYTCTMHPSVHSRDPGKCPICSMDLVPVMKKGAQAQAGHPDTQAAPETREFTVPMARQQQIGVTYATVESRSLSRQIRTVGSIVADPKLSWSFVARVDGYVQELSVSSPGEMVEKGAPLLSIYSPDLLTAERELIALSTGGGKDAANRPAAAARLRLRQWNMTDEQIAELEKSGTPEEVLTLRSPFKGIVTKVAVGQGAGVKTGDALVDVVDLSKVWAWVDFYETEIGLLRPGQKIGILSASYPGKVFPGTIATIDPAIDPLKRTARVRLEVENPDFLLRPGMYVNAELQLDAVTALAIPVSAVMPTGLRYHVFVDKGDGRLEPRVVTLGGKFGDYYAVEKGLSAGERVVSSANFLIDAEAQVQGALKGFNDKDASHE